MSDDLVKRLRDKYASPQDVAEAADRLEQLESSSEGWKEIADEYFDAIGERNTRIENLEEQLHYANGVADTNISGRLYAESRIEKLETALRSIAANACCDSCHEAALVARKALEEKDG